MDGPLSVELIIYGSSNDGIYQLYGLVTLRSNSLYSPLQKSKA